VDELIRSSQSYRHEGNQGVAYSPSLAPLVSQSAKNKMEGSLPDNSANEVPDLNQAAMDDQLGRGQTLAELQKQLTRSQTPSAWCWCCG